MPDETNAATAVKGLPLPIPFTSTLLGLAASLLLLPNQLYSTAGYYGPVDGGAGTYYYDAKSTLAPNGGVVVELKKLPGRLLLLAPGATVRGALRRKNRRHGAPASRIRLGN
jgi:hypothetical protein